MTSGLLLGRFLPPHNGHIFVGRTAEALVDALTILLRAAPNDAIPGALRAAWLHELFPHATVVVHEEAGDAGGDDWESWRDVIGQHAIGPVDILFGPHRFGQRLAMEIGAWPATIDPQHATVPITSAQVRSDPFAHWLYLPPPVRSHYAKSICLHGPESTGKSTIAPQLARHFDTLMVGEYGRTHCESFGLALTMEDLVTIGRTHCAMTQAALRQCNQRLILDTDPLMTAVWADMLFGHRDPWFDTFNATADFYLLLDIDMPWIDDGTRFFGDPTRRQRFMDLSRQELDRRGLPYAVIGGRAPERFAKAVAAIEAAGLGTGLG